MMKVNKDILTFYMTDRFCPPISQLSSEEGKAHCKVCPHCQSLMGISDNLHAAGKILAQIPTKDIQKSIPRAGEIRRIYPRRMDLLWQGVRYMNPPQVMVLTEPDELGFVRVAQLHDYPDLFDLKDEININEGFYAEAWNVYGLPIGTLKPKVFHPLRSKDLVNKVLERNNQSFRHICGNLLKFREEEINLGFFFSWQGNNLWLDKLEEMESGTQLPA